MMMMLVQRVGGGGDIRLDATLVLATLSGAALIVKNTMEVLGNEFTIHMLDCVRPLETAFLLHNLGQAKKPTRTYYHKYPTLCYCS